MVLALPRIPERSHSRAARAIAAIAFVLGVACAAPTARAADARLTFDVNGQTRALRLIEHARLKKAPRRTIIVLHAGRGSVSRLRRSLGLDDLARTTGMALVYPVAIGGRWDIGKPGAPPTNDVLFVRAMVSKLISLGVSDRRRIYIAGVSSGGMLALRLACESAELFAGAAAVSANLPADLAPRCKPSKPLPLLLINGSADPLIPFNGGKSSLDDYQGDVVSTDASLAPFAAAAGCGPQPRTRTDLSDRDSRDASRAVIERFNGCKARVELIRIEGGGHTIPGRRAPPARGAALGPQNNDIDTARVLVDFFRRPGR